MTMVLNYQRGKDKSPVAITFLSQLNHYSSPLIQINLAHRSAHPVNSQNNVFSYLLIPYSIPPCYAHILPSHLAFTSFNCFSTIAMFYVSAAYRVCSWYYCFFIKPLYTHCIYVHVYVKSFSCSRWNMVWWHLGGFLDLTWSLSVARTSLWSVTNNSALQRTLQL